MAHNYTFLSPLFPLPNVSQLHPLNAQSRHGSRAKKYCHFRLIGIAASEGCSQGETLRTQRVQEDIRAKQGDKGALASAVYADDAP